MTSQVQNTAIDNLDRQQLTGLEASLREEYQRHLDARLDLDLTRGKPSIEQLELCARLDGILNGDYVSPDGTDTRGYGGLDGLPSAKTLGAALLGVDAERVLVGGNSSLMLMYLYLHSACHCGLSGTGSGWSNGERRAKFLCPVPGYDRHFLVCEELGIEMIPVGLTGHGPDMDQVESLIRSDPTIKGMWCVPKYSNPTGEVYSDETVERIAALGTTAAPDFRIMWDNAYAVHTLGGYPAPLRDIDDACRRHGSVDSVIQFASTSKITFAGAGLAFAAASPANLATFKKRLAVMTIGPDKVNQLRHVKLLKDRAGIEALMQRHASIIAPKFDAVQRLLARTLGARGCGTWTTPKGGYFISFDTRPGLAKSVVALATKAGVKLTPAGAAYPYGKDPADTNIRLAPSYPSVEDVARAIEVFVTCVLLASTRQRLESLAA